MWTQMDSPVFFFPAEVWGKKVADKNSYDNQSYNPWMTEEISRQWNKNVEKL